MAACLPLDVLDNIAGCSTSAEDLIRMGSVCKEWRVASRNVAALNITRKDGVAPEMVEEILPGFIRQFTRLRALQIEMVDCGRPLHVMAAIVSACAALRELRLTRRGKNVFNNVPDFLHPSDVVSNVFRLFNLQHHNCTLSSLFK
jgi:hypothetical protein